MRKFELILEYPGSPKKGTIIQTDDEGRYDFTSIEGYPETWKELIEKPKEWEVIKLKTLSGAILTYDGEKCIHRTDFNGVITTPNLSTAIVHSSIYAIKRLSDREIFTVGDTIKQGVITGFDFAEEDTKKEQLQVFTKFAWYYIDFIIKVETPLFITEDGFKVMNSDLTVYMVQEGGSSIAYVLASRVILNNTKYKIFSTKEKAEEYILINKPCLSIQDLINLDIVHSDTDFVVSASKVEELVKSRIK